MSPTPEGDDAWQSYARRYGSSTQTMSEVLLGMTNDFLADGLTGLAAKTAAVSAFVAELEAKVEALEAAASVPPPADAEGIAIGWAVRGSEWDVATLETDEFQDADDAINFAQGLARKYPGDGWRAYEIRLVPAVPSSKEPTE